MKQSPWADARAPLHWGPVRLPAILLSLPALAALGATPDYLRDIGPILERRCVVCHGCYDAPCQLKLGAWEGVERGAHPDRIYDVTRLIAAP
ncbi:hypothetical protein [Marinobacterium aestuariivivens]|uniref:Uncharacterized protein n=1 Tax=Marinobacterium aestuariivivens TaxID=1698799 RepID=A0ABW2A2N6_9GAMM